VIAAATALGASAFAAPQSAPEAMTATSLDAITPNSPAVAAPPPTVTSASATIAPINDLHPRPLGPKRDAKPGFGSSTSDQSSAAATIWNNPIVRTGGSLFFVLVLIVALAALAKKVAVKRGGLAGQLGAGGRAPEGLLEVLGRYPLTRGQTLILLKVDSRVLLLSQTTPRIRGGVGALTTLCEITDPEEVASILVKAGEHAGESKTAKFTALLQKFDRTHADLPDHTEIESSGRRIQQTVAGDRSEMLDDQAMPAPAAAGIYQPPAPVIHRFPHPTEMPAHPGTESYSAIRRRLHALQGEAHR
jgi:flagellar biogenesis protein FliO